MDITKDKYQEKRSYCEDDQVFKCILYRRAQLGNLLLLSG